MNAKSMYKEARSVSFPPMNPVSINNVSCDRNHLPDVSRFGNNSSSSSPRVKEVKRSRHTSLLLPRSPYASFHTSSNGSRLATTLGPEGSVEDPMTPQLSDPPSTPNTSPKDDKSHQDASAGTKLTKRESYKAQRKHYRHEKKRVAKELRSTLTDPSIIILSDWLKIRGTLKGWTKLWCVLKPGLLLLYKSPKIHKSSTWIGTVLLNACEVIERPSKKDGFCFKLFHPLEQTIWTSRGPHGETIGALVQPLPMSYLIFRAPSEEAGKCWMDALELALRCSSLLMRSMTGQDLKPEMPQEDAVSLQKVAGRWNESDLEVHFRDHDLGDDTYADDNREADHYADGGHSLHSSDTDSDVHPVREEQESDVEPVESPYVEDGAEEFGLVGGLGQIEEVAEENKSLIWSLVKQVRPGMDLSKVVLPTFILEPRSFLDKLTDYYYHADIISRAVLEDDPFTRMKMITQWYLSGFYKKPRGLKKPYNPILGETFRCYWKHSKTGSRTFYIAEQVSHHPPVSAFYVTNRQDGFCIGGNILAKSKFYGNSLSAILDGKARLTLLTRGEDYILTMPYCHCKGILMGTLTMELGGKVDIRCEKTGYYADLEFKLKPFLGGPELCNVVTGKIKLGKETLAIIEGHWDGETYFRDKRSGEEHIFWNPTPEVKMKRLRRHILPLESQEEFESQRLWQHVSVAILRGDQVAATEEKTLLEEAQRRAAKERQAKMEKWIPKHFGQDLITGEWIYKNADCRPWDPRNDVVQYECNYIVQTKTRHKTPIIRTGSLVSMEDPLQAEPARLLSVDKVLAARSIPGCHKQQGVRHRTGVPRGSESSSPDAEVVHGTDSSESEDLRDSQRSAKVGDQQLQQSLSALHQSLQPLQQLQQDTSLNLTTLRRHLELVVAQQRQIQEQLAQRGDLTVIVAVVLVQIVLHWMLRVWM